MKYLIKETLLFSFIASFLLSTGCVSHKPIEPQKRISSSWDSVNSIAILPIIDFNKIDYKDKAKIHKILKDEMEQELIFKGYSVEVANGSNSDLILNLKDISKMTNKELASIGPDDEKYIFIMSIGEYSDNENIINRTISLKVNSILVDKKEGKKLWENNCNLSKSTTEEAPFAGPVTLILLSAIVDLNNKTCIKCISTILSNVPDNNSIQ